MALIVPSGGLVSQVNGTVDGKVYYRGRWGETVRKWVNPANTITPQRTAVRALFASLMSLFNSLTPDMQNDWNKFADYQRKFNRLAQPYIPTGLQVFLERNMNLGIIGQGPLLLPPDDKSLTTITAIDFTVISALTLTIAVHNSTGFIFLPANNFGVLYTTNNATAARQFQTNRYRITKINNPLTNFSGANIADWNSTWNPSTVIVGKKIFCKAVIINGNTGQACAPAYASQLVT